MFAMPLAIKQFRLCSNVGNVTYRPSKVKPVYYRLASKQMTKGPKLSLEGSKAAN
jgi:hypothetical protein